MLQSSSVGVFWSQIFCTSAKAKYQKPSVKPFGLVANGWNLSLQLLLFYYYYLFYERNSFMIPVSVIPHNHISNDVIFFRSDAIFFIRDLGFYCREMLRQFKKIPDISFWNMSANSLSLLKTIRTKYKHRKSLNVIVDCHLLTLTVSILDQKFFIKRKFKK